MTIRPETRELVGRLLIYESEVAQSSEAGASPTLRVYEKLRHSLGEFLGIASFHSLASRALTLATLNNPSLSRVRVDNDGSIQGLGEMETQFEMGNNQAGEAGIILTAQLLELLHVFLGEDLTLRLLQNAWPGEVFDDRNSVHGRQA